MIVDKINRKNKLTKLSRFGKFVSTIKKLDPYTVEVAMLTNKCIRKHRRGVLSAIEIETCNYCNNDCSFCPANIKSDQRTHMLMNESLFEKIVQDLKEINYVGQVLLSSNNEPFLDERMPRFIHYIHQELPNAHLYLYTNATKLPVDIFAEIIQDLSEIRIDNYNDRGVLSPNVCSIRDYCDRNPELWGKTTIFLRKKNEVLYSRGGLAPNKQEKVERKISCILPYVQMIVRPDGKTSLCCNDVYGHLTLGDLTQNSIIEVWNSKLSKLARKRVLSKQGRAALSCCKYCDSLFLPVQFIKDGK